MLQYSVIFAFFIYILMCVFKLDTIWLYYFIAMINLKAPA